MRWPSLAAVLLFGVSIGVVHADDTAQRAYVVGELQAQADVLARTRATVDDKLAAASADRARRVRAAYRLLRNGDTPAWVERDERLATARRRAAARWVLARDRREEALLADEAAQLAAADARLAADRAAAATVALPPASLTRPVRGTIVRRFGPYQHERSHALLSRRGLDFEVADQAPVHPVADGTVLYAGPIRGLDAGLILDHGGWLSVLGKLDGLTVMRGDHVTRDQEVGRAAGRRVYLEVRVAVSPGGVPVDPEPLFE